MAEGTGTGVRGPHQEIEDELSILDTNFDLTSQASGEKGQIATPSTRQSQDGIANTSLFQTSSSEGGGEIAIPNTESQVGIANPNTHRATPSEGTGEPERHQEIEDELSILDTNFDLTSQAAGGEEGLFATTSTHLSQVGIANTSLIQTSSSEVVVAGGDFKNANFGPHTSTSHFEGRNYMNSTINYHFHSATNQEASNFASQQLNTRKLQENTELEEGCLRICDDTVICMKNPIPEKTNVYEGYQEHVSTDGAPTRLPVAIKRIPDSTDNDKKEVDHLVTLARHPNVVRIIRSKEHKTTFSNILFIVMELCGLLNLRDYLTENRKNGTSFDFKKTLKFTKQLVKGMKHIHDNGIVHRDVKPENILLSLDETKVMFADFGLGKKLRQGRTSTKVTTQGQGTTGYMAPETLSIEKVSKRGDIFSFGVTMFELWSNGINPYGSDNISRDFNIMNNKAPDFSGLLLTGPLRNNFLDWISSMLQHDPRLRPTIDEVLKHIFLINAKKSEEESLSMSTLNIGARTPSVDESARKQSETVDSLMEDSKFKKAIDLLERFPQTQDQQMRVLECYVQLGKNSEVLKCIENMRKLFARDPRPKAIDVYKLGLDNLEKSYEIKAIAYFACAAKIYSFESDADEAVRRIEDCSYESRDAVLAMIEQSERMRFLARDVGMEIMNSIYCDITKVSNVNPDLKAEMEARCLNYTGACYRQLELYEKQIEVYKRGIDIMNRQFGENSSKYVVFGLLLNNMETANDNQVNYSEAESWYERLIDAKQRVEDLTNDEVK